MIGTTILNSNSNYLCQIITNLKLSDGSIGKFMVNSLILAAVKVALTGGTSTLHGGIEKWNSYYSFSSLTVGVTRPNHAASYLQTLVNQINRDFSNVLGDDATAALTANLGVIVDVAENIGFDEHDGVSDADAINEYFDDGKGLFGVFLYEFTPMENNKVQYQYIFCSLEARIAKKEIILYHSKKNLFRTRKWTETVYAPAELTDDGIINGLSMALSPIVNCVTDTPAGIVQSLIAGATGQSDDGETIEGERQTMVVGSSSVRITDPELLCLVPTHWVSYGGSFVQPDTQSNDKQWEFDN